MQVTIDSTESLDKVLVVLSTMFGVQITTETPTAAAKIPKPAGRSTGRVAAGTAKSATREKRSASVKATVAPAVDASAVRAWARSQGTTVSDRGSLPRALVAAYQSAQA